jgi:hypothetical protein
MATSLTVDSYGSTRDSAPDVGAYEEIRGVRSEVSFSNKGTLRSGPQTLIGSWPADCTLDIVIEL